MQVCRVSPIGGDRPRPRDLEPPGLTRLAQLQSHGHNRRQLSGACDPGQLGFALGHQVGDQGAQRDRQPETQRHGQAALQQQRLGCHADAIGREHTRQGVHQHPLQAQLIGQAAGVLGCGTAVTHQQRRAGIVSLLDRDAAHRRGHGFDRDLQSPGRSLLGREARAHHRHGLGEIGEAAGHHGTVKGLIAARAKHRRQGLLGQATEHHIGIGDRERTAAAIGGRTWVCSGRGGPHLQALAVKAHDRPPTGRHGVDRQHGCLQLQASHVGFGAALPGPVAALTGGMKHIGRGAAHVAANHRLQRQPGLLQRLTRHRQGTHHAAGRTRQDRVLGQQPGARRQGATGAHHPQGHRTGQGRLKLIEVAIEHRRQRSLHQGGLTAGHQSWQGADPVRQADGLQLQTQ